MWIFCVDILCGYSVCSWQHLELTDWQISLFAQCVDLPYQPLHSSKNKHPMTMQRCNQQSTRIQRLFVFYHWCSYMHLFEVISLLCSVLYRGGTYSGPDISRDGVQRVVSVVAIRLLVERVCTRFLLLREVPRGQVQVTTEQLLVLFTVV